MAKLTLAERNVLTLIAQGKLNKQVARKLGLSVRAVEDRRHRVMQKLKSESFADLMRFVVNAEHVALEGPHQNVAMYSPLKQGNTTPVMYDLH